MLPHRILSGPIRGWGLPGPFCWALRVLESGSPVCLPAPWQAGVYAQAELMLGMDNFEFPACATADRSAAKPKKQIPITDADEYLAAMVRYIHLNPVEAGVVETPEDYGWSSHRHYLNVAGVPSWLNASKVLEPMGGRKAFHEFVLCGNKEARQRFYQSTRQSLVLGGEEFVEQIRGPIDKLAREYP